MGAEAFLRRNSLQMSYPLLPGSMTSRRMRAGFSFSYVLTARAPSVQEMTSKSSPRRISSRPKTIWGSSSTIRILVFIKLGNLQDKTAATALEMFVPKLGSMGARDLHGYGEAETSAGNGVAEGIMGAKELLEYSLLA